MNAKADCLLEALQSRPRGAVVVEIGCARFANEIPSDGWSTVHIAMAATEHGWEFHSVDHDPAAVRIAGDLIAGMMGTVYLADGAQWLETGPLIDALYLDGSASPQEALAQYRCARLTPGAMVVIDDVQPIGESERGKGDVLLAELHADGFEVTIRETEPGYKMAFARRGQRA